MNSQRLWDIVRRARLTRVLAVYAGGSYAVLEVVDIFIDQLGLPDWVFPGAVILLLVGLPVVVATALVQPRPLQAWRGGRERAANSEPAERAQPAPATVPGEGAGEAEAASGSGGHWLTWRKAILGFVFAFAAWGLIVAGYMAMRSLGIGPVGTLVAAGVLEEQERVILAEFENNTDDPLLGRAATEAFRIDLAQSSVVTLVEPAFVEGVLRRMRRDPEAKLDLELAREVAIREGIKAAIAGEINSVGGAYSLSAKLVRAQDGGTLVAFRETAQDSTEIIGAIDALSDDLRERIGESLKSIRGNEPLDRVSTSSLEALRKYSQGVRALDRGEYEKGLSLLEEAVAIDTAFAMAWRKIGVRGRDAAQRIDALKRAYRHRDRLSDHERYLTLGTYYSEVTQEREKAIAAYQTLLDSAPDDGWALNNLANLYRELDDLARAESLYVRAVEVDSLAPTAYQNLISTRVDLGKLKQARATLERMAARMPEHPDIPRLRAGLAVAEKDYARAAELLRGIRSGRGESLMARANATGQLAQIALVQGRVAEAGRLLHEVRSDVEKAGLPEAFYNLMIGEAVVDVWLLGDPQGALQRVDDALERHPLDSVDPVNRPYLGLAELNALAGRPDSALSLLNEWERVVAPELPAAESQTRETRAVLALTQGRHREAIELLRELSQKGCPICGLPLIGIAFEEAGQPDSALLAYERYVETPSVDRLGQDMLFLAHAYERLGALYEARGRPEKAAHYYGKLVNLWQDADPVLQPRVESARRALRSLAAEA